MDTTWTPRQQSKRPDARFSEAHLSGADFTEAAIWKAHLADVDLSDAEGLEAIVHRGLSTVGIDTIYKSLGVTINMS